MSERCQSVILVYVAPVAASLCTFEISKVPLPQRNALGGSSQADAPSEFRAILLAPAIGPLLAGPRAIATSAVFFERHTAFRVAEDAVDEPRA